MWGEVVDDVLERISPTLIYGHNKAEGYGELYPIESYRELHHVRWLFIIIEMKTFWHMLIQGIIFASMICCPRSVTMSLVPLHNSSVGQILSRSIIIHQPSLWNMVRQSRAINFVGKNHSENTFETILKVIFHNNVICTQIFNTITGHLPHGKLVY